MAERESFAESIRLSERQFEELIPNTDVAIIMKVIVMTMRQNK